MTVLSRRAVSYIVRSEAMRNTVTSPILVSNTFFGMNSQDWPVRAPTSGGNGDSAPLFTFGSIATNDCSALHWRLINTSDGVFDWSKLDLAVDACVANGGTLTYVLYGCPTWLASTGAGVAGPYGGLGEGAYPTSLAKLTTFCATLVARYNSITRKIKAVQLFNEPENGSAFLETPNDSTFWWGTAVQYVDMLYTAYTAIKTADPGIVVLCPGTYNASTMPTWLDAQGPVTTKFGYQCFDAVAVHPYKSLPNGTFAGVGDLSTVQLGGKNKLAAVLATRGLVNLDYYITEWGVDSTSSSQLVIDFLASSADNRRKRTTRMLMAAARMGFKEFHPHSYGNTEQLSGDLVDDSTGVALGYQNAVAAMSGKTIVRGGYYFDGRERLEFSDGTSLEV